MTIFNFNRSWRLGWCRVVDDDDYGLMVGWWLSGRLCGRYVSITIPWRVRL